MCKPFYISVDHGGTHTRAAASDACGHVLRVLDRDGANPFDDGPEIMFDLIDCCVTDLCRLSGAQLERVCIASAGVELGTLSDTTLWQARLRLRSEQLLIYNDAHVAHIGAFEDGDGILVSAGTGSIVVARVGERVKRYGGWGHILGDEGSGFAVGRDGLKQAVLDEDNRRSTALYHEALTTFEVSSLREALFSIYSGSSKAKVAGFARNVLHLATEGDTASFAIVKAQLNALCETVGTAIKQGFPPVASYAGGMFADVFYGSLFQECLAVRNIVVTSPRLSALHAGLWLAMGRPSLSPTFLNATCE